MTRAGGPVSVQRLQEVLRAVAGRRIVVFGDLVLDEFLIGRIDRISREAPVLILEHQRLIRVPGGGANAAANVAALGGAAEAVGVVGADAEGEALIEVMRRAGVDVAGVARADGFATPTKTRILAGSTTSVQQQVVRVDRGLRGPLPAEARREVERALVDRAAGADAVLISDYGHGALDADARRRVAGAARPGRRILAVDSRRSLREFGAVTAATPNLEEAAGALGEPIPDEDGPVAAAAVRLRGLLGAESIVITRGSRGMTVAGAGRDPCHLPVFGSDEVADVTGAGDTVIAALTLALAAGADLMEAATLANVAAGLAVMKRGTATVTPEEIRSALREAVDGR